MKSRFNVSLGTALTIIVLVSFATGLLYGCAGQNAMRTSVNVAKTNYETFTTVQVIAADAYLNREAAQGTEQPLMAPYLNQEQWDRFVKASEQVEMAHNSYVTALQIALSSGQTPDPVTLDLRWSQVEILARAAVKILVDAGIVEGVVWQ